VLLLGFYHGIHLEVRIEPALSTGEKTGMAARINHYRLLSPDKLQETPG